MEFKSPTEVHDFKQDWVAELGADTISTSLWDLDTGITKDSDTNTTTTATVFISGGTLGLTFKVINTITTAAGRTHAKEWYLRIQNLRAG